MVGIGGGCSPRMGDPGKEEANLENVVLGNQKKETFAGEMIKGVRGWTWPRRRSQTTPGFGRADLGLR